MPGITEPTEYATLPEATEALSELLGTLLVAPERADAYRFFLSDPARAADFIDRDGRLDLPFTADGRTFKATITKT